MLLALLCAGAPWPAGAAPAANAEPLTPSDPLVLHLLALCRSDTLCCQQWFIAPPPQPGPPSDFDVASFTRLLILFANGQLQSPDGTLVTVPAWQNDPTLAADAAADAPTAAALATLTDAYWLLLMRMAVFCDGAPNQFFLLGKGCVCVPGAVCSGNGGSFATVEFVAFGILLFVALFVISWWMWQAIQDLGATRALLGQVWDAITISRQVPAIDLQLEPRRAERTLGGGRPPPSADGGLGNEFAHWWNSTRKSKEQ